MGWHGTFGTNIWVPGVRPFADSSLANTPFTPEIQANVNPTIWPKSTGFTYIAQRKVYIDTPNLATAPTVTWANQGGLGWPDTTLVRKMTSGFSGVNSLLGITPTNDNEAVSIINNEVLELWLFHRTSDTTADHDISGATSSYAYSNIVTDSGFGTAGTKSAGIVATLSSVMLGLLLKEELTRYGAFNHWISLCLFYDQLGQGIVFPGISYDQGGLNGLVAEGNLMTFPPGTTLPAAFVGLPISTAIFNAIRDYGAFVNDRGGANQWELGSVYDPTQTGNHSIATTSWSAADFTELTNAAAIIFPMLWRVGYPFDGYESYYSFIGLCSPQVQLRQNKGGVLLTVKRDSDNATQNISAVSANPPGLLDTTALAAFCSGTTGRVTSYGGQTFAHAFLSAGTNAPIIYQSGALKTINGSPAVLFDGSTNYFSQLISSVSGSVYFSAVIQLTDLLADYTIFGSDAAGGLVLRINATTGVPQLMTNTGTVIGTATASIAAGSAYLVTAQYTVASSWRIWINGQGAGGGAHSVTAAAGHMLVGRDAAAGTAFFKGLIGAWTILNAAIQINPQYSLENGLVRLWGPMGSFTRVQTTIAQDNFTDTNGVGLPSHTMDTGAGWTDVVGTHYIQSNTAQVNTLGSSSALCTFVGLANGTFSGTLTSTSSYNATLVFRLSDSSNYFQITLAFGFASLQTVVAGTATTIASAAAATGSPHTVVVDFYNQNISFTVDGGAPNRVINTFNENAAICGIRSVLNFGGTKCSFDSVILTGPGASPNTRVTSTGDVRATSTGDTRIITP